MASNTGWVAYAERHPVVVDAVELGGVRTSVAVPVLKDNERPARWHHRRPHWLDERGVASGAMALVHSGPPVHADPGGSPRVSWGGRGGVGGRRRVSRMR